MSEALERDLFAAIAKAPAEPGPRAVLADFLNERGDPWGALMQAELSRDPDPAHVEQLKVACLHSLRRALGVPDEVACFVQTKWGLPRQVSLGDGDVDTRLPAWGVVEALRFLGENELSTLLGRGFGAHGWASLRALQGLSLRDLEAHREGFAQRFTHLTLTDAPLTVDSFVVTGLLARPCARLAFGAWPDLTLARQTVLEPDVWLSGGLLSVADPRAARHLAELLAPFAMPGWELYWQQDGRPSPVFLEALAPLPAHRLHWRRGEKWIIGP